jgi:hypothetical protein
LEPLRDILLGNPHQSTKAILIGSLWTEDEKKRLREQDPSDPRHICRSGHARPELSDELHEIEEVRLLPEVPKFVAERDFGDDVEGEVVGSGSQVKKRPGRNLRGDGILASKQANEILNLLIHIRLKVVCLTAVVGPRKTQLGLRVHRRFQSGEEVVTIRIETAGGVPAVAVIRTACRRDGFDGIGLVSNDIVGSNPDQWSILLV